MARVIRTMFAEATVPTDMAGSIMMLRLVPGSFQKSTYSNEGIHPKVMESTRISMIPCQNSGIDRLNMDITRTR